MKIAAARELKAQAPVFAALGDETRLRVVARLCERAPLSITQLAAGSALTRQAVTKHLRVLEDVGLVRSVKRGRESLFALEPAPLQGAKRYLDLVSAQWDEMLGRLKEFVEE